MSERIVAAAIMVGEVILTMPIPARHHSIMYEFCQNIPESQWPIFGEQGFLTSSGQFVSRAGAKKMAREAGQKMLIEDHARHENLFSEDLW